MQTWEFPGVSKQRVGQTISRAIKIVEVGPTTKPLRRAQFFKFHYCLYMITCILKSLFAYHQCCTCQVLIEDNGLMGFIGLSLKQKISTSDVLFGD